VASPEPPSVARGPSAVMSTGPNPDVEVDASLACQIRLGKLGPIVTLLDAFGQYVAAVLTRFQPGS
jgi:hypothetical protein